MVILGLGSNLGDRLEHLRRSVRLIKAIPQLSVEQVSPVYVSDALLPETSPITWNNKYLNLAIRCKTSQTPNSLLKQIKNIEARMGRLPEGPWAPRIIDIDILAWDTLIHCNNNLYVPHPHLHKRPFALWPLTDVAPEWAYPAPGSLKGKLGLEIASSWGSRFNGQAPLHTLQIPQRIDTPQLMGILNITPDSFSDGGKFIDISSALNHVKYLADRGAEIIDIGAEATGPNAKSLSPLLEWQRLGPVLQAIMTNKSSILVPPKISIDTRHSIVAKQALAMGVDYINDVSGLDDSNMRDILSKSSCMIIFMHNLGIPVNQLNQILPPHVDPVITLFDWAKKRLTLLENLGITRERLIFDPGIGYGKTAEQSLKLIKNIDLFHELGVKLLIGHSRKSFLTQFNSVPACERDIETTIISLYLAKNRVDYLRVHQVDAHARAFKVNAAMQNSLTDEKSQQRYEMIQKK